MLSLVWTKPWPDACSPPGRALGIAEGEGGSAAGLSPLPALQASWFSPLALQRAGLPFPLVHWLGKAVDADCRCLLPCLRLQHLLMETFMGPAPVRAGWTRVGARLLLSSPHPAFWPRPCTPSRLGLLPASPIHPAHFRPGPLPCCKTISSPHHPQGLPRSLLACCWCVTHSQRLLSQALV